MLFHGQQIFLILQLVSRGKGTALIHIVTKMTQLDALEEQMDPDFDTACYLF